MEELIYIFLAMVTGLLLAIFIKLKELVKMMYSFGDLLVTAQKDINFHGRFMNVGLANLRNSLPDHYISENGERGKLYRKKEE